MNIGNYNTLKVARKANFGYYLDARTGRTTDDVLLPFRECEGRELTEGEEVEVFIYKDSEDRLISTLKKPLAKVASIAYLEVTSVTNIGAFMSIGLEKDILVPFKEQAYKLEKGKKYLVYVYVDKSERIAATTNIDKYLDTTDIYNSGEEVTGIVYGYQTNGSVMVAIEKQYKGVILKNEFFEDIEPGDELELRVKKYYEDGRIGLTPRQAKLYERDIIGDKIMEYLQNHGGFMPYNDKSSPEDIKGTFGTSKNYFKIALGGLMKKGLVTQNEAGTRLK